MRYYSCVFLLIFSFLLLYPTLVIVADTAQDTVAFYNSSEEEENKENEKEIEIKEYTLADGVAEVFYASGCYLVILSCSNFKTYGIHLPVILPPPEQLI